MTAITSALVDRLLADLDCAEAKQCYDESKLKRDIGADKLTDDEIRDAFARIHDCLYQSTFQVSKSCTCPLCEGCE